MDPIATPVTRHLKATADGVAEAAAVLRSGGLCAFPTETVYGLGGDARSDMAVARIFEAKGRPRFNPLIVHVPDLETASRLGVFADRATRLAAAFWPGPLTLVVPLRPEAGLSPLVTAGHDTVALRVPDLPLARRLLAAANLPVAAPSANPSGRISPTRAEHVTDGLDGRIDAILDGGPCAVGVESTIVGVVGETVTLLRPGGLPVEAIEAAIGAPLARNLSPETPLAPGQLSSHYAPDATVRLNVTEPRADETLLGFGPVEAEHNLSRSGDLTEAAANLFHALRALDAAGVRRIAVSPVPMKGLGVAINDRLSRAAAPRPGSGAPG